MKVGEISPARPRRARRRPFSEVPAEARQHAVRMPDGVRLATDVYLPASGRRCAALLCRLPYDKCGDECFVPAIARWFVDRGYAVVAQDVRGKVRSAGELEPFTAEAADAYHTIDWLTTQSWCNGVVGMFGDSYSGFAAWAAASSGHPALRAIAPRGCSADMRHILTNNGVFMLESTACWALETWVDEALYDYDGELDWDIRPLSQIVPTLLGGDRVAGLGEWAIGLNLERATVPVTRTIPALHLGGFADHRLRGGLDTWRHARGAAHAPQFLMMDAVDHGWTPLRESDDPYRDPAATEKTMQAFLDDYLAPVADFFDYFLRRAPDGYDAPRVRWRLGRGPQRWRHDHQWPPADSRPITWSLTHGSAGREGALSIRPQATPTTARWVHDPQDPVPSRVHPYFPLIDPPDEHDVHRRPDVRTFSTEPVPAPMDLAGPVELRGRVTSSATSTHLVATLCDVLPDGSTHRILDAATLVMGPWPQASRLLLGDTGYRIRAGHRLRLALANSAFPRYALHPGTTEHPWTAVVTAASETRIQLGGTDGAVLHAHLLTTEDGKT